MTTPERDPGPTDPGPEMGPRAGLIAAYLRGEQLPASTLRWLGIDHPPPAPAARKIDYPLSHPGPDLEGGAT